MDKPRISVIAAMGEKTRAIGKNGGLLWRIKEDMQHFVDITSGHVVIMGRKTWDSIPAKFRPLSHRTNIVITRNPDFKADGAVIANSLEEAFEKAREFEEEEIIVMGGAEIYKQALPLAERLYLTLVESGAEGDAFFPEYGEFKKEIERKESRQGDLKFTFLTLER